MITGHLPTLSRPGSQSFITRQIDSLRPLCNRLDIYQVVGSRFTKHMKAVINISSITNNYDLIHAHYGLYGIASLLGHKKTPIVISLMGSDVLGTPDCKGKITNITRIEALITKYIASRCDAVIVKSSEMSDAISSISSFIIPNGIDMNLFTPQDMNISRKSLGWNQEDLYIIFPGNPNRPEKNFLLAENAVNIVKNSIRKPIHLIPLVDIPPDSVPLLLNAANLTLMTSFSEGSPNVVKESLSCQRPVVSVDVGDVQNILSGVSGCYTTTYDVHDVANTIVQSLSDNVKRTNGREVLSHKGLTLSLIAQRVFKVYEEVLSR